MIYKDLFYKWKILREGSHGVLTMATLKTEE
jgi:hypothetical protein